MEYWKTVWECHSKLIHRLLQSVINPFAMKKYAKDNSLRGAKTDKLDSKMIANYGIEKWFKLQRYEGDEETYAELKLLGRRYRYYMELHVKALQELTHILDYVMPGIKKMFNSWNEANGKDQEHRQPHPFL